MTNELLLVAFIFLIVAVGCLLYLVIPMLGAVAEMRAEIATMSKKQDRLIERVDAIEKTPAPAEQAKPARREKRRSPKPRIPDDLYDKCESMLKDGKSEKEVVAATGVSKSTVYRIHKRLRERLFKQWLKENGKKKQTSDNDVLELFNDEPQSESTEGGEE